MSAFCTMLPCRSLYHQGPRRRDEHLARAGDENVDGVASGYVVERASLPSTS